MNEIFWWALFGVVAIFLFCFLVLTAYAIECLRRLADIMEKWVENGRGKEIQPSAWPLGPTSVSPIPERKEIKAAEVRVPQLPPEAIAPHLKRPPRSAGFGPAVSRPDDSDQQSQQTGGGTDQGGQTTPDVCSRPPEDQGSAQKTKPPT
jgi:hypothetical protein